MRGLILALCLLCGVVYSAQHELVTLSQVSVSNTAVTATSTYPVTGVIKGYVIWATGGQVITATLKSVHGSYTRTLDTAKSATSGTALETNITARLYNEKAVMTYQGQVAMTSDVEVITGIIVER